MMLNVRQEKKEEAEDEAVNPKGFLPIHSARFHVFNILETSQLQKQKL